MYLTGSIRDLEGRTYPMAGVLPGRSVMTGQLTLGYRKAVVSAATFLAPAGMVLRGHEFHYSDWIEYPSDAPPAYRLLERGSIASTAYGRCEGYAHENLLASYIHLHWGGAPSLAERFVAACRGWTNH
jgi:cobyrinic acid a,c-diamide synthase